MNMISSSCSCENKSEKDFEKAKKRRRKSEDKKANFASERGKNLLSGKMFNLPDGYIYIYISGTMPSPRQFLVRPSSAR